MTLDDFKKYFDPKVVQEFTELEEEVMQHKISMRKLLHEVDKTIRKDNELLNRLDDEFSDE